MTDTLPHDLDELFSITRTLAAMIEPLQMLLAMEQAPGIGERLDALMAQLTAISGHMQRAADVLERAVSLQENDAARQEAVARSLMLLQRDVAMLKEWFIAPLPEVEQT